MRSKLVAGNWKMNMSRQETNEFIIAFEQLYKPLKETTVVLCPPFVWLDIMAVNLPAGVWLGAQNLHSRPKGAFTGEVSAPMLKDAGCKYVIVGHSERRQMGETDQLVRDKSRQALDCGLIPIVCVGESEVERNGGLAKVTVTSQLQGSLADLQFIAGELVVAYEPVWAIGTGKTASAADAQEMASHIRSYLQEQHAAAAANTQILYGGSVTPENAGSLFTQPDIDGALVGGASLDPVKFWSIITA